MSRKRRYPIVFAYCLSLLITIALLVAWVLYVVQAVERVRDLAGRVGVAGEGTHWVVLAVGCVLFTLLIGGLTWQLAQALAARRYSLKQDEFVANVTHELKSPLAAIKLHAQTLQQGGVEATQQERSLALVLQQAERMEHLVDDVLESSRLGARQPLALAPLVAGAFFAGYFPQAAARVASHGVTLRWQMDDDVVVLASPAALERVMDNLVENATRFSPRGGEVRCRVAPAGGNLRIEVDDDGPGVPKKELQRIFDRFYQAGNAQDASRRGTGLGLSIVAGLVREMRGRVRAEARERGTGARFVVELPIAERRADARPGVSGQEARA